MAFAMSLIGPIVALLLAAAYLAWALPRLARSGPVVSAMLADPRVPETPGAGVRELLGYGDREKPFEVSVSLEAV